MAEARIEAPPGVGSAGRLGAHHFACLRAVAEGVPATQAALQYLPVDGGPAAGAAYRRLLDQVRALAKRRGDARWRLLGLDLQQAAEPASRPSLDDWAATEGLEDWSQAELQAIYDDRFGTVDEDARRRQARNARLRVRRMALLRELESWAVVPAAPHDLVAGWLPEPLAGRLFAAGILTLADLRTRIQRGGVWWSGLQAVGPTKAARLAGLVETLLGPVQGGLWPVMRAQAELTRLSGRQGSNRLKAGTAGIAAEDDLQAIHAWVAARAGSPHTAAQYQREAERMLLWCVIERGKSLSDTTPEDCRAYMDFIAAVPEQWISRRKVPRLTPGWAPFKGELTLASQRLALDVLNSLFGWLVHARYLSSNPWVLVNRRLGDDGEAGEDVGSRAFTPAAWQALMTALDQPPAGPSAVRLRWICSFVQMVGLRSAELLRAQRGHLKELPAGWVIRVHGKGRRNRTVPVPRAAIEATRMYFASRALDFATAPAATPLLAALDDPSAPVTYPTLYATFARFVRRAIRASALPPAERERAMRASAHWLRHTYATRSAEQNVPPDVLQENLGQADPRTTARYYRAQLERRQEAMEKAFSTESR